MGIVAANANRTTPHSNANARRRRRIETLDEDQIITPPCRHCTSERKRATERRADRAGGVAEARHGEHSTDLHDRVVVLVEDLLHSLEHDLRRLASAPAHEHLASPTAH